MEHSRRPEETESTSELSDRWMAGSTYEAFMGRWSRSLAPQFLSWLQIPGGVHWLDVGCGTGALTSAICAHAEPASVVACDPGEPFIKYARQHLRDSRASFVVAGVGTLPRRATGYGSITSQLALNFFPNPRAAIDEMRSLAASGGTVSACVWDYAGRMDFLRIFWDAATAVDPRARQRDEGVRFAMCRPRPLTDLFRQGGLRDVRCESIEISTEFAGFYGYWQPFLGGTGPAPSYVASLNASARALLARQLEQTLPQRADGTIALIARAWAVRGTVS